MRNRKVLLKCRLCVTNEEPDKRTVPLSGKDRSLSSIRVKGSCFSGRYII